MNSIAFIDYSVVYSFAGIGESTSRQTKAQLSQQSLLKAQQENASSALFLK